VDDMAFVMIDMWMDQEIDLNEMFCWYHVVLACIVSEQVDFARPHWRRRHHFLIMTICTIAP
jgi:hypothetical protein